MTPREALSAHLQVFAEMGVNGISRDPAWRERAPLVSGRGTDALPSARAAAEGTDAVEPLASSDHAAALGALRDEIGDCQRCILATLGRRQVVFGVGNPDADLMFVGEAPGETEDLEGVPFVGEAGQLLTRIIGAIGLSRDDVYIANVIKCRPPNNRNPEPAEVATCSPFLLRQIDIVRPKVLVALGTFAAHALLGTNAPISRLRGRLHDYRDGIKLMPTYHPAYLLPNRSPEKKREVWEDMKIVRALLAASN
jgi:uracil-DNA glycosylase family 4